MKLERCTPIGGDETAGYKVIMSKSYTVRELIDKIVSIKSEWGYICVEKVNGEWIQNSSCEYKHGVLLSFIAEELMNSNVVHAQASGGWSRMDYFLKIL